MMKEQKQVEKESDVKRDKTRVNPVTGIHSVEWREFWDSRCNKNDLLFALFLLDQLVTQSDYLLLLLLALRSRFFAQINFFTVVS